MTLAPTAQKAVYFLRRHYVYVERVVPANSYKRRMLGYDTEIDKGIYSTRTGMRVKGFSKQTLNELKQKGLLGKPVLFPNPLQPRWARFKSVFPVNDKVYSLSTRGLQVFIMAAVIEAVHNICPKRRKGARA